MRVEGQDGSAVELTAPSDDRRRLLMMMAGLPFMALVGGAGVSAAGAAVPGCGPASVTDPGVRLPGRVVAHCDPGAPAPKPLAARQKVTVSIQAPGEYAAPLLLGIARGEFDKENLDVEVVTLMGSDAFPQIAAGKIDGAYNAGPGFFNAVNSGIEMRQILSTYFPPHAGDTSIPQGGLWARKDVFSDPANPDLSQLKGTVWAASTGRAAVSILPISEALEKAGIRFSDLKVQKIPAPDLVQALQNGGAQSAWIIEPFWIPASKDPNLMLIATFKPIPNGGVVFSSAMLAGVRREAGVAFVRAWIRTINTYLRGDYHANPEILEILTKVTGIASETIVQTPSLVWDWEIATEAVMKLQKVLLENDVLDYKAALPEQRLVDRSLYLEAVGAA